MLSRISKVLTSGLALALIGQTTATANPTIKTTATNATKATQTQSRAFPDPAQIRRERAAAAGTMVVQLRDHADMDKLNELLQQVHGRVVRTIPAGPLRFLVVQGDPRQARNIQIRLSKSESVASVVLNQSCPVQASIMPQTGAAAAAKTAPPAVTADTAKKKEPEKKKPEPTKKKKEPLKKKKKKGGSSGSSSSGSSSGSTGSGSTTSNTPPPNPYLLTGTPNDPDLAQQWSVPYMNFNQARDSGLQYNTPLYAYYIDTGATVIPGELNVNGIQFDYSDMTTPSKAQEPMFDAGYHGTATTTLLCTTDNSAYLTGVANFEGNRCYTVMFRCMQPWQQTSQGDFLNYVGVIDSLSYLLTSNMPPGPICLSTNSQPPNTFNANSQIQALAQQLRQKGFVVVLPAGNWGMQDPSPEQYIRRVAAIGSDGNLASFSDYGPFPAVAPGANIWVFSPTNTGNLGIANGTSLSAPAWCAAILDVMGVLPPSQRTAVLADQIVLQTASITPQGYSCPNLYAAIEAAAGYSNASAGGN